MLLGCITQSILNQTSSVTQIETLRHEVKQDKGKLTPQILKFHNAISIHSLARTKFTHAIYHGKSNYGITLK